MTKQGYWLYIGVFLVGAMVTPLVLGWLQREPTSSNGDRPEVTTETNPDELNLTFGENLPEDTTSQDTTSQGNTPIFEPNDTQETVIKDYETTTPDALQKMPMTIPQYALNQPNIQPYPNYWSNISIPTFSTPNNGKTTPKPTTSKDKATTPTAQPPTNGVQSAPVEQLTLIKDKPTPTHNNTTFSGTVEAADDINLKDFVNHSPATPMPTQEANP